MHSKWIGPTLAAVMMAVLGCITVEVLPGEETPLRTVVPFPSPTWTPVGSGVATPAQKPSPTSFNPSDPSVSRVFFASEVSRGTEPVNVATEFPGEMTRVYAFATYAGMSGGIPCESVWYMEGEEILRDSFAWSFGESGETWLSFIEDEGGLSPGRYNWELRVEGELMGGGAFAVGAPSTGTPLPEVTSTPAHVQGPRIAFVSLRDRNNELYIMNADGSGLARLTDNPAVDYDPACSPDGTRLAFMSRRDGNNEIYVMDSDGSSVIRLTNNAAEDWDPAWSRDGGRIAFVSDRAGNAEIYIMSATGGGVTRVTGNTIGDRWPSWSPDGNHIVLASPRGGNDELLIKDLLSGDVTRLTNNPADDWDPEWSPDGSRIAFVSDRDGNEEIYVVDADGGGVTRLTNNPGVDIAPAWSPDGRRIAFVSYTGTNGEIYVMNADGSGVTRVTNNPADDWDPTWCAR
jgi:dipeptidyl aminopeptidase/acylaminoacyl peptidase